MKQKLTIEQIRKINDESDQLLYELARHDLDRIAPDILLQALKMYARSKGIVDQPAPAQLALPAPVTAEPVTTTTTTNTAISTIDLLFEQEHK